MIWISACCGLGTPSTARAPWETLVVLDAAFVAVIVGSRVVLPGPASPDWLDLYDIMVSVSAIHFSVDGTIDAVENAMPGALMLKSGKAEKTATKEYGPVTVHNNQSQSILREPLFEIDTST